MATFEQLPSGSWQARVTLPSRRFLTTVHPTREAAERWAATNETAVRDGLWDRADPGPRDAYALRAPTGLDIHIPAKLLTPMLAEELAAVVFTMLDHDKRRRS